MVRCERRLASTVFQQNMTTMIKNGTSTRRSNLSINKSFYYGTLRWLFKDRLTLYATYWVTREHRNRPLPGTPQDRPPMAGTSFVSENKAPSFGVAYDLRDRVVLKAQYTRINRSTDNPNAPTGPGFNIYSLAVSVFF